MMTLVREFFWKHMKGLFTSRGHPFLYEYIGLEDIFIIIFTRRIWIMTSLVNIFDIRRIYNEIIIDLKKSDFLLNVASFMNLQIHAYYSDFKALYSSDL